METYSSFNCDKSCERALNYLKKTNKVNDFSNITSIVIEKLKDNKEQENIMIDLINAACMGHEPSSLLYNKLCFRELSDMLYFHELAARKGLPDAQIFYGKMLLDINPEEADYWLSNAFKYCKQLAESGDAIAQFKLARSYFDGMNVEQDYNQYLKWIVLSAEQNYAPAQFMLSVSYHNGDAVNVDLDKCLYWTSKAADNGLAEAEYMMGYIYEFGECGVTSNKVKAKIWYEKAAKQGNQYAIMRLNEMV